MFEALLERASSRFVFVVGKGGVGKTTTASELARGFAGRGEETHLISTDPAHSLRDLLPGDHTPHLHIEEFDARAYAEAFFQELRAPFIELIERGTYLDEADAASFLDLSVPGIDEVMAVLRLVELHESDRKRIVVDTAPTGHTLRLLDSAKIIDSWVDAARAMAEKASAVATALVGQRVPLQAEQLLDEWRSAARRFEAEVMRDSCAVVVTRPGSVIDAETKRLIAELDRRGLAVAATMSIEVPHRPHRPQRPRRPPSLPAAKLILVAGKGGVGKTTCASAIAVALAKEKKVLLISTDPAGSLTEVLQAEVTRDISEIAPNLFVQQIDAVTEFEKMRTQYRSSIDEVFEKLGIHQSAQLDRKVVESLFDFAPPGIDEIIALVEILEHASEYDVTVIDSAPTGHFLRLIQMPDIALDWVRALMRLLVKYGAAGSLDALAGDLLAFAKRLKQLKSDLATPGITAVFLVTLAEPMVRAETARLSSALQSAGVPVAATILNFADDGERSTESIEVIRAPAMHQEVVGLTALRSFLAQWDQHGD